MQTVSILVLAFAFAICAAMLVRSNAKIIGLAENIPVRVVPGAAAGVYAPGVTEMNVLNAIRYVQSLGANLTPATARKRLDELEAYCAPEFITNFRIEKVRRVEEIISQQQSRSFVRDSDETFTRDANGVYTYKVTGPWEFRSGSVVMSNYRHEFIIRFTIGTPDKGNPYGTQLLAFDPNLLEKKN